MTDGNEIQDILDVLAGGFSDLAEATHYQADVMLGISEDLSEILLVLRGILDVMEKTSTIAGNVKSVAAAKRGSAV